MRRRSRWRSPNRTVRYGRWASCRTEVEAIKRLVKKLGPIEQRRVCYEAGPTGYGVYWQLAALGVSCEVVAPTLVPVKPGDRVKTDRRDALKLARSYRSGDLTPGWVPDATHEALRDLVRAREAAKKDQLRARHRLSKFLLRQGRRPPTGVKAWTPAYLTWVTSAVHVAPAAQEATLLDDVHQIDQVGARLERLAHALDAAVQTAPVRTRAVIDGLQALRGVALVTAVTIGSEVGDFTRFARPRQLLGYSGAVASEHASGTRTQRGAITKTGTAHLRRVLIEAAWCSRHRPAIGTTLRKRHAAVDADVKAMAWTAQHRLHARFRALTAQGKPRQLAVTAVGRELLGFIWAIATTVHTTHRDARIAA